MGTNNAVYLEVIEWLDNTGEALVQRIPEGGSGEIKYGAQLTVRESQSAVFFYQGKAIGAFGAGRHTLKTANIPILTKIASLPWGFHSPLRAEVYFTNMKVFTNLKWGSRDPVAFKDSELGLIRLRVFGIFNLQIIQPLLFINSMVGTQGIFTTREVEDYLSKVIVSRFNDYMGETLDSILNLPARYEEISAGLSERLAHDFEQFGLGLNNLYINSVTPPPEVQKAIDDRSRLGVFDDMDRLIQMKAAMAMEKAAETNSTVGSGMGMGMGMMMPAMFSQHLMGAGAPKETASAGEGHVIDCPECKHSVPVNAHFCSACGYQMLIFGMCGHCEEKLPPNAKFCPACGKAAQDKPKPVSCPQCSAENLPGASFCNQCGEKLE
jgi:membrane protease subunit (stomatin/prohibitin family)